MLAIFGTIALFLIVGFLSLSYFDRGRPRTALFASVISLVASFFIFWLIIPTSFAGINGQENVEFDREISNIKTWDEDMETYISFDHDGKTVTLVNDDSEDKFFAILFTDGEPRWQKVCDHVSSGIALYGAVNCQDRVLIPVGG